MKNKLDYNLNWSDYFRLCTISPSGLVRIRNYKGADIKEHAVGNQSYFKNGKAGAWRVGFRGKVYYIHRIIWVMTYGTIYSSLVIDHLDGNPSNNKIENLSLKTQMDNLRNREQRSDNKTGITGICLTSKEGGYWYYEVNWNEVDGKHNSKRFSINKLGEQKALSLAIAYRNEQIQRLISEGAYYTERHCEQSRINSVLNAN